MVPVKRFAVILSAFILFLHSGTKCQDRQKIDSLNNLFSITEQDTIRIRIFGQLCWIYAGTRDKLDSAGIYSDSIYRLVVKIDDERTMAYSHFYYGIASELENMGNLYPQLSRTAGIRYGYCRRGRIRFDSICLRKQSSYH